MEIEKDDVEWLISLFVTIYLATRKSKKPPKTKEPQKRKRRKRK